MHNAELIVQVLAVQSRSKVKMNNKTRTRKAVTMKKTASREPRNVDTMMTTMTATVTEQASVAAPTATSMTPNLSTVDIPAATAKYLPVMTINFVFVK